MPFGIILRRNIQQQVQRLKANLPRVGKAAFRVGDFRGLF
jgi:hypothetical protein